MPLVLYTPVAIQTGQFRAMHGGLKFLQKDLNLRRPPFFSMAFDTILLGVGHHLIAQKGDKEQDKQWE